MLEFTRLIPDPRFGQKSAADLERFNAILGESMLAEVAIDEIHIKWGIWREVLRKPD